MRSAMLLTPKTRDVTSDLYVKKYYTKCPFPGDQYYISDNHSVISVCHQFLKSSAGSVELHEI